jgi:hypothetical protein
VSVDGFDEKVKMLKASGMDANAAFTEAFLQQAEQQIATVGSVTEQTISSFKRFEASLQNFGNVAKTTASGPIAGIVESLADGLDVLSGNDGLTYQFYNLQRGLESSNGTYADYIVALNESLEGTGLLVSATGELEAANASGWVKLKNVSDATVILTESEYNAARATSGWTDEMYKAYRGLGEVEDAVGDFTEAVGVSKEAMTELSIFMAGEYGKEIDNFKADHADLVQTAQDYLDKIDELEGKKYLTVEQKDELEETKQKYDETIAKVDELAAAHEEATKRILYGLLEQQLAMDGVITQKDFDVLTELANRWGLIDDKTIDLWNDMKEVTGEMDNAALSAGDIADQLDRVTDKWVEVTIETHYVGDAPAWQGELNPGATQTQRAAGGPVNGAFGYGEYGQPEAYMPNVGGGSGQVVNPQQLIQMMRDAMQTSGSGRGVTIENMNIYPNDGTGAVLYGAERAKAMVL